MLTRQLGEEMNTWTKISFLGGARKNYRTKKNKKIFLEFMKDLFIFCTIIKWFISMRKNWSVFIYSVEFGIKIKKYHQRLR